MAADSRVRRGLRRTAHQELHERLMREVLARNRDLDMVLKGGTAPAFTRGLNRHSTDLDFDSDRPVDLRDRIASAARAWAVNLDQKMAAIGGRIEARDLFDLAFVLERFGGVLRNDQIQRADAFTEDLDRLEQRYKKSFEEDRVLKGITDVEDTVLRFRYATTDQRDLRWPQLQDQRIPIPMDVLGRVFVVQRRARVESANGTEPRDPEPSVDHGFLRSQREADRKRSRAKDVDLDRSISR